MWTTTALLLLWMGIGAMSEDGLHLRAIPEYNSYVPGSEVTIKCVTTKNSDRLNSPEFMQLSHQGQGVVLRKEKEELTTPYGHPYYIRHKIKVLNQQDAGKYTCDALIEDRHRGDRTWTTTYTLYVQRPPAGVSMEHLRKSVKIGERLDISCVVQDPGFPKANILWYKGPGEGTLIWSLPWLENGKQRIVSQIINSIEEGQPYYCAATNGHDMVKAPQPVIVTVIAPFVVESRSPGGEILHPMYDMKQPVLTLTISGTNTDEATLYRILRNPTRTQVVQNAISHDVIKGEFKYGQKNATEYKIQFDVASKTTCNTVTDWNGKYQLWVKKKYPWGNSSDTLKVDFEIDVDYPAMWGSNTSTVVVEKIGTHNISILCEVCAKPMATFTWSVNEKLLPDQSESSIYIPEVLKENYGAYKCSATNMIGGSEYLRTFEIVLQKNENLPGSSDRKAFGFSVFTLIGIICVVGGLLGMTAIIVLVIMRKRRANKDNVSQAEYNNTYSMVTCSNAHSPWLKGGSAMHPSAQHENMPVAARTSQPSMQVGPPTNIQLENIYANSNGGAEATQPPTQVSAPTQGQPENIYANTNGGAEALQPTTQMDDNVMLYAELDLKSPFTHNQQNVVHGIEERTEYASVDWKHTK